MSHCDRWLIAPWQTLCTMCVRIFHCHICHLQSTCSRRMYMMIRCLLAYRQCHARLVASIHQFILKFVNNLVPNLCTVSPGFSKMIRADNRQSSPASLPDFHCFKSQDMLWRWTHDRLLFTKLQLLKNLKKRLYLHSDN